MKSIEISPSAMNLVKMEGAGNSFLITWEDFPLAQRSRLVKRLCDPHFGIGADGFVFLEQLNQGQVTWDFYNSDGSAAEFCGNAARCVASYIVSAHPELKRISLKTVAGIVYCEIKNNRPEIEMPPPKWVNEALVIPMWPRPVVWINTGVPHLVLEVPEVEDITKFKSEAALMRSWPGLGPAGSNVTFVFEHTPTVASAASYERGVEDFTLACGTGAVAAASYLMKKNQTTSCLIQMPGGDLEIFVRDGKVIMAGPARQIAEMKVWTENYK